MITPIFRIFDLEKAQSFYIDYLGFKLDWNHQFAEHMPHYIQISMRGMTIHLSEHHADSSPGASILVKINDLKVYHASLSDKNYPYANPAVEKTTWGTIELKITDPFSNRIIFYEEDQS
jgi:uncharacterized glyoxalase superfamily protein PhnB